MSTIETAKTYPLLINGQKVGSDRIDEVRSPWDGSLVGTVNLATEAEVEMAIRSGAKAAAAARDLPRHERRRLLREIAAGLRAEKDLSRARSLSRRASPSRRRAPRWIERS